MARLTSCGSRFATRIPPIREPKRPPVTIPSHFCPRRIGRNGERNLIKQTLLNLMRVSGAFDLMRLISSRRALILTYHRFSEREDSVRVSARAFYEQVEYLAAHYTIVRLWQLAGYLLRGRELPPRMAAITIDDGYRDAYEIAFPILRKHRAPATVFVVTDFVEGNSWLWTDKPRYLTTFANQQQIEV